MTGGIGQRLDWLLEDLVGRVAGASHAIALSADGLLIGRSEGVEREDGEHLSAIASGLQSLARSTGQRFRGGAVLQTVIEMEDAVLVVTTAGHGASLALLASTEADMGQVAYEMNLMVKQVGAYLSTQPRVATPTP